MKMKTLPGRELEVVAKRLRQRAARCLELAQERSDENRYVEAACLIAAAYTCTTVALELDRSNK